MTLTVQSFQKSLDKAIEMGEAGLDLAIECYLYAQVPGKLKEIRKLQPDFTQEATANAIRRVWKIDPVVYLRIASKLGDGDIGVGRDAMKKFGSWECERAEKLLGATQLKKLRTAMLDMGGPSEFSAEVDKLRAELEETAKKKRGDDPPVRPSLTWKQKFEKVLAENADLRSQIASLVAENRVMGEQLEWFRANSGQLASEVENAGEKK